MAAPSRSTLFRLAGQTSFSAVSSFDGSYTLCSICFAVLLCMNYHAGPGKILLVIVVAHAILYLASSSLLWLRFSQSFVLQGTPSAKDVDLTCSLTFLLKDATCLPAGPTSLDWPVNPFSRSDSTGPLLPPDVPSGEQQRVALPASVHSRWRQDALHAQPQILQRTTGWDGCGPFLSEGLRCITWNTGASLDPFSPDKGTESPNSTISKNFWTTTTSFGSRKCMERTSFFKLSRSWVHDFDSLVPLFLIMTMREELSASTGLFSLKTQL